jgi:hypothetical protein
MLASESFHMLLALAVSLAVQGGLYAYCLHTLAG